MENKIGQTSYISEQQTKFQQNTKQGGFTLVELSIVLVVIGIIIGGIVVAKDLQRNATYARISSDFVQAWATAYDKFYTNAGRPPGDSVTAPTGIVNGVTNTPLCGVALLNAFLAAGVDLPAGRSEGSADRFVYLDSNGNPQEVVICFSNVAWAEATAVGTYTSRNRNVLTVNRVTPALANQLDNAIDGLADARFGRLREQAEANNLTANSNGLVWSRTEVDSFTSVVAPANARDEAQVALLNAYMKMSR